MNLSFILIIFLANYYRKALKENGLQGSLNKEFKAVMAFSIAALFYQVSDLKGGDSLGWLAHVLIIFMAYRAVTKNELKSVRTFVYAIIPIIAINLIGDLIELINQKFYDKWDDYFQIANLFAVIWMFAIWYIVNKQKKALEKERQKTKEKEAENRIAESLKAELELKVAERTAQLTQQKEELQSILDELRAAQTQLIQAEKMASLGELTAGIAHEIQNPLNFVNNFSEVNAELITELKEEIDKGHFEEVKAIADDIEENQKKINNHGKRADAIVKGMLQHSRASSGKKELTDINALAEEYLRLSYHGLRAKDKTFNASLKTNFDETITKVNVISQDIGRVLLNLINNAFYSVKQKKQQLNGAFEPLVTVTTKKVKLTPEEDGLEIVVKDNGTGIPEKALEKIFQPFFTTKPTGEGTGLGLSLSYDIVTKAHGGEIKVETQEGEGTTFIIQLPLEN